MKITAVRGYHVECVLPEPLRNSVSRLDKRAALVVELIAEDGTSGWGECTQSPLLVWTFIETVLAAQVLGRSCRATGRLRTFMNSPAARDDIAMMAVSAIDMAWWDLRGRVEGVAVADLIGGRVRDRVRAYASGPFMKPGDRPYRDFAADAEAYLAAGFQAMKPRCGSSPRADAEMVGELRRVIGPDMQLMADANRGYSRPAALEAVARLEESGLLWLEEPLAPDDLAGYRALSPKSRVPLAAGEALARLDQFGAFLAEGAVQFIQPDLYLCGGFTGALRIVALAEAFRTPYVPHVWGTAVNFYASLQLAAALPSWRLGDGIELPMFEWDMTGNALLAVAGLPRLGDGGTVAVPDAPGIGVEIDRTMFEPYVIAAWSVAA